MSWRVVPVPASQRTVSAAHVRTGDRLYCTGCACWERVIFSRPYVQGRRFIRTNRHDAYKLNAARVQIARASA